MAGYATHTHRHPVTEKQELDLLGSGLSGLTAGVLKNKTEKGNLTTKCKVENKNPRSFK